MSVCNEHKKSICFWLLLIKLALTSDCVYDDKFHGQGENILIWFNEIVWAPSMKISSVSADFESNTMSMFPWQVHTMENWADDTTLESTQ